MTHQNCDHDMLLAVAMLAGVKRTRLYIGLCTCSHGMILLDINHIIQEPADLTIACNYLRTLLHCCWILTLTSEIALGFMMWHA